MITQEQLALLEDDVRRDGKSRNVMTSTGSSVRASLIRTKNARRDVTSVVWTLDGTRLGINNLRLKLRRLGVMA